MAMGSEERRNGEEKKQPTSLGSRYLIIHPEKAAWVDILRFFISFSSSVTRNAAENEWVKTSEGQLGPVENDHRFVIVISIIVRRILAMFSKPMKWTGIFLEWLLNLFSQNDGPFKLLLNLLTGNVVVPERNSETFISSIGHLDGRIDLYKGDGVDTLEGNLQMGNRALMDLCIMASKLAYENAKVVKNIADHHWKMHFVDFYDGWNDFQKERSTQVFILCDKPKDANFILISFRGTEPFDADDWSTDFDYSWYEIPILGKVHMGFLEALGLGNREEISTFKAHLQVGRHPLKSIFSDWSEGTEHPLRDTEHSSHSGSENGLPLMVEMSAYYAVRSKLRSLLDKHKKARFIVTGHSLGGALAIMFPTVLLLHNEEEMMQRLLGIYTFGQPRIGDRQLGRFMEAHLNQPFPRYFRVVYCNDLVPRLPYDDKTFLYKHFGQCLYYNSAYQEMNVDEEPNKNYFGMRYLIPEYLGAIWELIRSLTMTYIYGPEYRESSVSIFLRVVGLAIPGISAHSPVNYVNSVRLGKEQSQMSVF